MLVYMPLACGKCSFTCLKVSLVVLRIGIHAYGAFWSFALGLAGKTVQGGFN